MNGKSNTFRTAVAAISLFASLAVGAVAGYCFALGRTKPPAPGAVETKIVKVGLGNEAAIREKQARIRELERRLEERDNADLFRIPDELQAVQGEAGGGEEHNRDRGPRHPGEWLENMKRDDPERYAEVTNHMTNARLARQEEAQYQLDFLSSVDTSTMSQADRETHERLQNLIARREELLDMMDPLLTDQSAVTEEERLETGRALWETLGEINELNKSERENLIKQTAERLGYQGEMVGEISTTISTIIKTTDSRGPGWRGPGGRGPGGRRGQGWRGGNR